MEKFCRVVEKIAWIWAWTVAIGMMVFGMWVYAVLIWHIIAGGK